MRSVQMALLSGFAGGAVVGFVTLAGVSAGTHAMHLRADRLPVAVRAVGTASSADPTAVAGHVELSGPNGEIVEFRDPNGMLVIRSDPTAQTTTVVKGMVVPVLTVGQ